MKTLLGLILVLALAGCERASASAGAVHGAEAGAKLGEQRKLTVPGIGTDEKAILNGKGHVDPREIPSGKLGN